MPISSGTRLGPYEILAPLGAGGMGEVYRSRDSRLHRDVALKIIPREVSLDAERVRRFEQEARTAGTLSHPNVCAVYDLGSHEGSPFVVMELLEGQTLREILREGPVPIRKALQVAAQAAEGLAAAHAKGIVHRDLKPENLFVTNDGRVKVLDFGLAKLSPVENGPVERSAPDTMTSPGAILGTTAYLSPEQIRGEPADARSDVFSLGIVLFETLCGRRPFDGRTPADVMSSILNEEASGLATLRPDAPPQLSWLVRRCLVKDPNRRLQTSLDVRNEVEEILREMETGVAGGGSAERNIVEPVERRIALTAAHVRQLSVRNPRLIGYRMTYLDNRIESETLVVILHGIGGDHRRFEPVIRGLRRRGIAITLAGFAPADTYRPVLSFDDHSRLLRILLGELVRECRPARTILVGYSAGADQFLRMLVSEEGLGIDVAGLVALGVNVSLETCFVTRLYAAMHADSPDGVLRSLKSLGDGITSLPEWLSAQAYITQTFTKFSSDLEPLSRFSAEVIAPFENGGDPLPGWYRAATERIPSVRFVFSDVEAGPAEAVLARHLESNVLGDRYTEASYVTEPVPHRSLSERPIIERYVESVVSELEARGG